MLSRSFLYEYFKPIAFCYRTVCHSPTLFLFILTKQKPRFNLLGDLVFTFTSLTGVLCCALLLIWWRRAVDRVGSAFYTGIVLPIVWGYPPLLHVYQKNRVGVVFNRMILL